MIFRVHDEKLQMNTLDFLVLPAVAYLGAGLVYGIYDIDFFSTQSAYSLATLIVLWIAIRQRSFLDIQLSMSQRLEKKLLILSFLSVLSIILFFASVGAQYFSMDKVERSQLIANYFALRVGFWAASIVVIILICEKERRFHTSKMWLLFAMFAVLVIEGSRELLIIVGLQFVIYKWQFNQRLIVPSGFLGFIFFIFSLFFVTVLFKPLFYLVTVGELYDGGWLNYGELVNWYRWLNTARLDNVDLQYVQRNDLAYLVQSLYSPFSSVQSASSIWFTEILGNEEGQGRTFGYSGMLWLSAYFSGWTIVFPWLLLGVVFSQFAKARSPISFLFVFSVCVVSYRFFRSEWVLVVKTILWLFFYPGLLLLLFSKLRLGNRR